MEKGREIDLTPDEVAGFDPSDITAVGSIPEPEEEPKLSDTALEEMTHAQLKAYAKELELSQSGSKADLEERIRLHLAAGQSDEEDAPEMTDHVVTQDDLDANPALVEAGVQVGDTIQLPASDEEELSDPNQ